MAPIALLGGPTADRGREAAYAGRALRLLRAQGADVVALRGDDDAEALDLARAAIAAGAGTLVVVGGPSLVQVGAEAVLGTGARLGVVPSDGGDPLTRRLGIPPADPDAAVAAVLRGRERAVDLVGVAGRAHVGPLWAGFDALVAERAEHLGWRSARLGRAAALAQGLRRPEPVEHTLEVDGETLRTRASLVAVAATASYPGLRASGAAPPVDGLLDVVVLAPMSRRDLALARPRLRAGTLVPRPGDVRRRARRVTLAAPGVVAYAGEKRVGPLPVTADVLAGAVRVLVP